MINCQIVIGSTRKHSADTFFDQTTRFACVPDLAMAFLSFSLAETTEFKIVVDDIGVHKEILDKGKSRAEEQLDAYHGRWNESVKPIYDEYAF